MIQFDLNTKTYVCPFCGHVQAFNNSFIKTNSTYSSFFGIKKEEIAECSFDIYTLTCCNSACKKYTVLAINISNNEQIDISPKVVYKEFPDFIPEQIRNDYIEASIILDLSPKAAATLLRRCLQGMIHDFWNIHEKNLYDEINKLKDVIPLSQWNAIDGLRKMGNIGAHMEKDVNTIIDIDPDEATQLLKLIELLFNNWYIAKHSEEELYDNVVKTAEIKDSNKRKNTF